MIFGPDDANPQYGDERYDEYVNLFYTITVISAFIMSGLMNPALFWYHHSVSSSIPSILFRILNVSDFLTTTCLCPYLAHGLLTSALVPHNTVASHWQRFYSAMFAYLLFMSVSITTLMTATRVYAIKYPLKIVNKRSAILYPMVGLSVLAMTIVAINCYYNATWDRYLYSTNRLKLVLFDPGTTTINNWPELAFGGILMSIAVSGCVCAVITGKEIYKSGNAMKEARHSMTENNQSRICITILMLSAGIQVAVLLVIVQFLYSIFVRQGFPYHAFYFMYGNGLFCSLVLSVVNPIITVARSTGFKQFYYRKIRGNTVGSHTLQLNSLNVIPTNPFSQDNRC